MNVEQNIRLQQRGTVGWLTLHRPERRNAMTPAMIEETYSALQRWATRDDLDVVVLSGHGRWFCPGADTTAVAASEPGSRLEDLPANPELVFQVPVLLREMPQVTVAAINGGCAGAGLGWAIACDLRVATRSARFNTAFLSHGIAGDMCLPWTLPRLLGPAQARRLSLLPGPFGTDEALAVGVVDDVVDDVEFPAAVEALVAKLSSVTPSALRQMKKHYLLAETMSLQDFSILETSHHLGTFDPGNFG